MADDFTPDPSRRRMFSVVATEADVALIRAAATKDGYTSRSKWVLEAAIAKALTTLAREAA